MLLALCFQGPGGRECVKYVFREAVVKTVFRSSGLFLVPAMVDMEREGAKLGAEL